MNLLKKFEYYLVKKGKVKKMEFSEGEILIDEFDSDLRDKISLKSEDIKNFYYSENEAMTGDKIFSLKTYKGNFIYRSNSINSELYYKMLEFLGEDNLSSMQRRAMRFLSGIALLFIGLSVALPYVLDFPFLQKVFFLAAIFNCGGIIYEFFKFRKMIRDYKTRNSVLA